MTVSVETDSEIIEQYLDWCANRAGLAESTVRSYRYTLAVYERWLAERGMRLADVRYTDVEEFARRPRRGSGEVGSPFTVRREIVTVREFHAWAVEHEKGGIRLVKLARSPKAVEEVPKPVPDELWRYVWGSDLEEQDRMLLGLGYFLGLRRIEIVTVPPHAFDTQQGVARFRRKGGGNHPIEYLDMIGVVADHKPHVAERVDEFVNILHETARFRSSRGFPTLWWDVGGIVHDDCTRLNKRCSRILRRLGLPTNAFTPHQLRHSCATNLFECGVEPVLIRNLLSHADLTTTMRYMRTSGQLARWRRKRGTADA